MKMKMPIAALFCALAAMSGAASAKGCLAGAAVGGVAGHVAGHHGVLGAAAGCAIGHHRAKVKARDAMAANARTNTAGNAPAPVTNRLPDQQRKVK